MSPTIPSAGVNHPWIGQLDDSMSPTIPSAGVNHPWIGNVALTPLDRGKFVRVHFAQLPTAARNALSATPRTTHVKLQINVNATTNSGPCYPDNVRFES
ncbi:hypothetical protein [Sorangium sp. So ce1182]|uniref:hypothetical protein n=1 Tax=Sorangium sp. So ce1182 TaxID=3133334 RepID=UPI003F62AE0F